MRYSYLILSGFLALLLLPLSQASAQEVVDDNAILSCGQAITGDLDTNPRASFCNAYERQLAYKNSADKFRQQITERQQNFAAPRIRAREQYMNSIKWMNESYYVQPEEEDATEENISE